MTKITDLPHDLVEEILSRVPIRSSREVRSTCKPWNVLFQDESFTKKHLGKAAKEILGTTVSKSRVCLMRFNLYNHKDGLLDPSIKKLGELNQVEIHKVFHCDGLLLCIPNRYIFRPHVLMLCNPYLRQVRKIKPSNNYKSYCFNITETYNIGYDMNNNLKILRCYDPYFRSGVVEYEIYDFKSDSWRVLDVAPDWGIPYYRHGLSLKGNTYFVSQERLQVRKFEMEEFLLCFDFTREQFGPPMPLWFHSRYVDCVMLSAVGEERLAMLFQCWHTNEIEIRITTKVEPNAVSWSNFLKVDLKPFTGRYYIQFRSGIFFIDKEGKIAVIFPERIKGTFNPAYIIGKDGYYKKADSEIVGHLSALMFRVRFRFRKVKYLLEAKRKTEIIGCLHSF